MSLPAITTPALADHSNSHSGISYSPETARSHDIVQIDHGKSNRQLCPRLDASEGTPGEQSSLNDASPWSSSENHEAFRRDPGKDGPAGSRRQSQEAFRGRCDRRSQHHHHHHKAIGVTVRFSNRPNGTPLSTILEQQSYASLRVQASFPSAARRFAPIRANATPKRTAATPNLEPDTLDRRQISHSLDEFALHTFRKLRREEQDLALNRSAFFEGNDKIRHCTGPRSPIQPPPPTRVEAPPAHPRWPGDLPTSIRTIRSEPRSITHTALGFFRPSSVPSFDGAASGRCHLRQRRCRTPRQIRAGLAHRRPPQGGRSAVGFEDAPVYPSRKVETDQSAIFLPERPPSSQPRKPTTDGAQSLIPPRRSLVQESVKGHATPPSDREAALPGVGESHLGRRISPKRHGHGSGDSETSKPPIFQPESAQPPLAGSKDDDATRYCSPGITIYHHDAPPLRSYDRTDERSPNDVRTASASRGIRKPTESQALQFPVSAASSVQFALPCSGSPGNDRRGRGTSRYPDPGCLDRRRDDGGLARSPGSGLLEKDRDAKDPSGNPFSEPSTQPKTTTTKTPRPYAIRSAALTALLPIAAAEGIVIPRTISISELRPKIVASPTPACRNQARWSTSASQTMSASVPSVQSLLGTSEGPMPTAATPPVSVISRYEGPRHAVVLSGRRRGNCRDGIGVGDVLRRCFCQPSDEDDGVHAPRATDNLKMRSNRVGAGA